MGRRPLHTNWMEMRMHVVVLPLDDGPAMSTTLTPFLLAISSAMCAIFFS